MAGFNAHADADVTARYAARFEFALREYSGPRHAMNLPDGLVSTIVWGGGRARAANACVHAGPGEASGRSSLVMPGSSTSSSHAADGGANGVVVVQQLLDRVQALVSGDDAVDGARLLDLLEQLAVLRRRLESATRVALARPFDKDTPNKDAATDALTGTCRPLVASGIMRLTSAMLCGRTPMTAGVLTALLRLDARFGLLARKARARVQSQVDASAVGAHLPEGRGASVAG